MSQVELSVARLRARRKDGPPPTMGRLAAADRMKWEDAARVRDRTMTVV